MNGEIISSQSSRLDESPSTGFRRQAHARKHEEDDTHSRYVSSNDIFFASWLRTRNPFSFLSPTYLPRCTCKHTRMYAAEPVVLSFFSLSTHIHIPPYPIVTRSSLMCSHRRARDVRRHNGNVAPADVVFNVPFLGLRRKQEDPGCWEGRSRVEARRGW
jgi:hypothetical protein